MPQRSPLNFWLLIAATICVNAVAWSWAWQTSFGRPSAVVYQALCYSQLTIACIWALFAKPSRRWTWIAPVAGVMLAAIATQQIVPEDITIAEALGMFALHVVAIVVALLVVQRIPIWARLTGFAPPGELRYSVGSLLILMTIVAVLITLLKGSESLRHEPSLEIIILYLTGYPLIVVVIVTAWLLHGPRLLRIANPLAVACLIGLFISWWSRYVEFSEIAPNFLIQIAVIWLWLDVGHIMPRGEPAVDGNAPPTTPAPTPPA